MKIKDISVITVNTGLGKNWLFIRISTKDGLVGWGECYTQNDRVKSIASYVEEMKRYLLGYDTEHIKYYSNVLYRDFLKKRGSMDFYSAFSGIEQALWDINGKALGVPVYKMLGGRCREKLRVYASGWALGCKSDQEVAEQAVRMVEAGFTALKIDPYPGPWCTFIDKDVENRAVKRVEAIREAVGPDIDLLIDNHRRFSPYHAVRLANMMREYDLFWFEEPVDPINIDGLAYVAHHTDLAVVAGETLYTKQEFRQLFEKQAVSIINPDIGNCGGILAMKEIGAMAEAYDIAVSPHVGNGNTVGLAATVQAGAVMPNFIIMEYMVQYEQMSAKISPNPIQVKDGYIYLDELQPGLGVELEEIEMSKYPYEECPLRYHFNFRQEQ
jgi:galactonate dehydratase